MPLSEHVALKRDTLDWIRCRAPAALTLHMRACADTHEGVCSEMVDPGQERERAGA